ncbi:hypothetical protein AK812_SmicGene13121 [Symbiodinium microadriaticum]|uniref:Uncharacterized protein n=1 Tax=Symbiodinium microadriaticum TaxID=2951 RepID=A0A1Q9E8Y8_SYMMI|nr:hypothetical protein AK812_SmicGene13121 [Symbiodinium microadriaticum]
MCRPPPTSGNLAGSSGQPDLPEEPPPWPSATEEFQTRHDELCFHLARLECQRSLEHAAYRKECEELFTEAVELRSERKDLEEEVAGYRRKAVAEEESEQRCTARSEKALRLLAAEVQVAADWVIEDEPERRLLVAEEECQRTRASMAEYEQEYSASKQLADRLRRRLRAHEERKEEASAKNSAADDLARLATSTARQELENVRHEVKLLKVQLAIAEEECSEEAKLVWQSRDTDLRRLRAAERERQQFVGRLGQAKLVWQSRDTDLRRLRAAERERQQFVGRLGQARFDRDNLDRNYSRIISSLREHETRMEQQADTLAAGLRTCRQEGEEMVASMKENDQSIAEMRKERWETEAFIEHLGTQVARLEDERNSLKASLGNSGSVGLMAGIDHDVKARVLSLMDLGDQRVLQEEDQARLALMQDEADLQAVAAEIGEQEEVLQKVEHRNAELRAEVQACRPLLQR